MLSHFEISPIGVYTYYLFFELFLYIIFIVWHYESYHLYCVVRAIYIGLGPVLFFTMPCHVHVHMTEEHIVSLRYTSSFCLRYPGSIKTHSRYISDRVKSSSSHFLLSPKCTCSTLFFNQFGPFLTLVFAFFSNYCYQASFSYENLPPVTMFCNVNLLSSNSTHVFTISRVNYVINILILLYFFMSWIIMKYTWWISNFKVSSAIYFLCTIETAENTSNRPFHDSPLIRRKFGIRSFK